MDQNEILFTTQACKHGQLGLITLNRPSVLNALNHAMFLALDEQLATWEANPEIQAVIIQAVPGRAFSAGGDIRSAYERAQKNDPHLTDFFKDEYRLDKRVFHFSKPYIALLNGITMGGGAGISINGAHRVVTQQFSFAMPETGIGFFPDVGASYFLSRLPGSFGLYLALTGARITAADCLALGLVDYFVDANSFPEILAQLCEIDLQQDAASSVKKCLQQCVITNEKSELMEHVAEINLCFAKPSVEEIMQALSQYPNPWCTQVLQVLNTKSPTSLKVTFQQIRLGATLDFDACIDMEFKMTCQFMQAHDFFEGVRAAIIDKDQTPQWQPAHLADVTTEALQKYCVF